MHIALLLLLVLACHGSQNPGNRKITRACFRDTAFYADNPQATFFIYTLGTAAFHTLLYDPSTLATPASIILTVQCSNAAALASLDIFLSSSMGHLFQCMMTEPDLASAFRMACAFDEQVHGLCTMDALRPLLNVISHLSNNVQIRRADEDGFVNRRLDDVHPLIFEHEIVGKFMMQRKMALRQGRIHRPMRGCIIDYGERHPDPRIWLRYTTDGRALALTCRYYYNVLRPASIASCSLLSPHRRLLCLVVTFHALSGLPLFMSRLLSGEGKKRYLGIRQKDGWKMMHTCLQPNSAPALQEAIKLGARICKQADKLAGFMEYLTTNDRAAALRLSSMLTVNHYRFADIHRALCKLYADEANVKMLLEAIRPYATILSHGHQLQSDVMVGMPTYIFIAIEALLQPK